MQYLEVKPSAALSDYIKCFWYLERNYATQSETIFPDGCIDLMLQFGSPLYVITNGQRIKQPAELIIGQLKQPLTLTSDGLTRVIGVRFFPYGAYPFLQLPLKELSDQTTALGPIFGKIIHDLAECLDGKAPVLAFQALEQFLWQRLTMFPTYTANLAPIRAAALMIYQRHGAIEVASLANYANMTERSLERKFGEIVGYAPKILSRILRFNRVRNALMLDPLVNLTDLTYQHNYYDQAHFIHDFQAFAGHTPSTFAGKVISGEMAFYKKP